MKKCLIKNNKVYIVTGWNCFPWIPDGMLYKIKEDDNNKMPIITDDCMSCSMCIEECPVGAIDIIIKSGKGYSQSFIDPKLCINCGVCVDNFECPANAIKKD